MIWISAFFLIMVHVYPWMFRTSPYRQMGLNPNKIMAFSSGVMILPYFIILMFYPEESIVHRVSAGNVHELLAEFGLYYSIGIAVSYIGVAYGSRRVIFKEFATTFRVQNVGRVRRTGYALFAIAVIGAMLKIQLSGGMPSLLTNLGSRSEVLAVSNYVEFLSLPASYVSVFTLTYCCVISGRPRVILLVLLVAFLVFLVALFGGRKQPMLIVVMAIIAGSVYNPKSSLLSPRYMLIYVALGIFFFAMLKLRLSAQSGYSVALSVVDVVRNFSYIDTYIFILDHFDSGNFWYGVGFLDMVWKFIPLNGLSVSVPLDDGVYVRSLAAGMSVKPPTAYEVMYQSSWPPESFGGGYLNFGLGGVVLFFAIKGFVTGLSFSFARACRFSPAPLFIMIYISLTFHMTNLRIVQLVIVLVGLALSLAVASRFGASRVRTS